MNYILVVALVLAGFGFIVVLYKLLVKTGKKILTLPKIHILFFLIYAILGLSGFLFDNQHVEHPQMLAMVIFLVGLSGGLWLTVNMFENWEWAQEASLGRKIGFIGEITLVSIIAFSIAFVLSENRGIPKNGLSNDLLWWYLPLTILLFLPILVIYLHSLWNEIPKKVQLKHIYRLPLEQPPPFIETGGASLHFLLVIPLLDNSKATLEPKKVVVPFDQTLGDVFHYVVHDHNVVKRFAKRIVIAQNNQRHKLYGWSFYRVKKKWWGFYEKKYYLNHKLPVGGLISDQEWIYVQREEIWKQ